MLEHQETIQILLNQGYWLDIVRPEDYEKTNDENEIITKK